VNPLTTFVRSLGNAGAIDNAQTALATRQRDDWVLEALARRLETVDPAQEAAGGAGGDSAAA
jgi:hypothetical protein